MARRLKPRAPACEAVTAQQWRAAMGHFPSGVTIVTTWSEEAPIGTTASSICSVSLDPPMLLVCLGHENPALGPIETCGIFGVNILGAGCAHLAMRFATNPEDDRFAGIPWRSSSGGAPELEAAPVFIDCVLDQAHAAGDHKILVGRGSRIAHNSADLPLLYHRGAFPKLF